MASFVMRGQCQIAMVAGKRRHSVWVWIVEAVVGCLIIQVVIAVFVVAACHHPRLARGE